MDTYIGVARVYVRSRSGRRTKHIADRILDLQRGEIQALQRASDRGDIDADAARGAEPVRPWQCARGLVDVLLTAVIGVAIRLSRFTV